MRYEIAARSFIGGRSYQEDSWRVRDHHGIDLDGEVGRREGAVVAHAALVVVADGMGGHGGGAPASRLVADSFTAAFFKGSSDLPCPERLDRALDAANRALATAKRSGSDLNDRSGTTLVAGALLRNHLVFLSVGDSTIWRFRDSEVHRINATHERAADVDVRAAELGTDEAWSYALTDENRFAITSAVMGDPVREKQIDARRIEHDDVLIFASDGIETLSLEHLRRAVPVFLKQGGVGAVADGLSDLVERTGGATQDNTTLVVVRALSDSPGREAEPPELAETPATARTAPVGPAAAAPPSAEEAPHAPSRQTRTGARSPEQGAVLSAPERAGAPSSWLTGAAIAAVAFGAALLVGWYVQPWLGAAPDPATKTEAPASQAAALPGATGVLPPPQVQSASPAGDEPQREKTSGRGR